VSALPVSTILETGAAALLFAAIFVAGSHVHPFRGLIRDRRTIISFCGGMAAAYVFVHVMPELHTVRSAVVESANVALRYEGMAIYFLSLVGFLVFYGLDHLSARLREPEVEGGIGPSFKVRIGGFAAYVWLMSYLLVHNLEDTGGATGLYALAIAVHFLALDHSLREEHGAAYERIGRFVLAGMCVAGWGVGLLVELPRIGIALLLAMLSGAVIMNSLIMELPSDKDGRFLPFMWGGILYGMVLWPMG
jgi:hypothetical protein